MNFIYVIHLMCWNYLITDNRNSKNRSNSEDGNNKGVREARATLRCCMNAVASVLAVSVSVVYDQVDQVVPAHQVDDIDEVHELDPVHQVDHKDEHGRFCDDCACFCDDMVRFCDDIVCFCVVFGSFCVVLGCFGVALGRLCGALGRFCILLRCSGRLAT